MLAYICTQITTTKKLNTMKTSTKLNKIIEQAQNYIYGGNGYNSNKFNSKKWATIRSRFEIEADKIGGVDYNLGDCLA
jgi:hypothetical protein